MIAPSLPARERGLKHFLIPPKINYIKVAPRAGAWIETSIALHALTTSCWSLPARERGLKQFLLCDILHISYVAPRAGAWIETLNSQSVRSYSPSLPARERGLKHI